MIPVCRKILGREPRCPEWITGLALAIIGTGGLAGGVVGGAAAGAKSLAEGQYPWDDPGAWLTNELKGIGMGIGASAVTAGAGQAVGPMLGAAADSLAVGSNLGTIPQQAGAATPTTLGSTVPKVAGSILDNAGRTGSASLMQQGIEKVATNTLSGSLTGAASDYEHPLRGALMGAAGGAASGVFNSGANALFRGQGAGIVPNSVDAPNRGFSMMGSGDFERAYSPSSGFGDFMDNNQFGYDPGRETFSISRANIATPPPTLASRAMDLGINQGSNMAGRAASRMVGSAMTPTPEDPMSQNPYAQYGRNPYWMRRM